MNIHAHKTVTVTIVLLIALVLLLGLWYVVLRAPVSDSRTTLPETSEGNKSHALVPDEEVRVSLSGTWQSSQDGKFIRTFGADGLVTDTYEGVEEATSVGTWSFVEDPSAEQEELSYLEDKKVIKIQFPEEVLYFALLELTETNLELSYLGRGNTLSFTRID